MKEHKRYALLENGTIEPLFYDKHEMRNIEDGKDGSSYLIHDVYLNGCIALCRNKIVRESDNREDLVKYPLTTKQQQLYDALIKTLNLMPYPDKAIEQVDRLVESLLEMEK